MSRLIKRHAWERAASTVKPTPPVDPLKEALGQLAALQAQLSTQQTEHEAALQEAVQAAFARGRAEGSEIAQRAGETQAAESQARRATLAAALDDAHRAFCQRLDTVAETLAIRVALAALERVLGDGAAYRDLVTATVVHRLRGMHENAVVRLRVSAADFAETELPAVAGAVVEPCAALAAGTCVLELAAGGELDLSLPGQHHRLVEHLLGLADG